MGGCSSSPEMALSPLESNRSSTIDRQLERKKFGEDGTVKLLLLGAGESGKSTIFKQMRILYGNNPSNDDDMRFYGTTVRANIVVAMRKLLVIMRKIGLEQSIDEETNAAKQADEKTQDMPLREAYDLLIAYLVDKTERITLEDSTPQDGSKDWVGFSQRAGKTVCLDSKLFLKFVEPISILWHSHTMKLAWAKRAILNVNESHKEYFKDLSRIASPDYRPSTQDLLLARVRTTTVIVEKFRIDEIDFEMYDVGGQRSERRKWIECFDDVDAVIFVAALSEYDQNLEESKRTNRMVEALELFRDISNNPAFVDTSIMLFLNKKDLFAEKLLSSDIVAQKSFADYTGPAKDFDSGVQYFIDKFKECLMDDDYSENFIHVTMATDTNNMEFVLEASRTIIMNANLARSGFLGTD